MCKQLAIQVDKLDSEQRKNSIRIFSLPEQNDKIVMSLKSLVTKNVINIACPNRSVNESAIAYAKRIGESSENQSRMVLVKLTDFDIKLNIFQSRDKLHDGGIRDSNDLTIKQRNTLKDLSVKGQKGYFKGGQLYIIPPSNTDDNTGMSNFNTRVFKQGIRTLPQELAQWGADLNSSSDTVIGMTKPDNMDE